MFVPADEQTVLAMAVSGKETAGGRVVSVILFMISMGMLSICLSRRVQNVRDWARLPVVCWLVLVIYVDSIVFIMGASILSHGYDMELNKELCSKAILLCLACYMTTKVFLYYFLVERAYIIRGTSKRRLKDKLYVFNSFGMLIPYCIVIALNFYFRFADYKDGQCRIGMKKQAMIPLIAFDIVVNVYLTSLFLFPLRSLYSYKNNRNSQARSLALRTFIGSVCTLVSSVVNLTVVMVLEGEPGWICLMCCNVDILFSVLVLHWITSKDNASTLISSPNNSSPNHPVPPLAPPTYPTMPKRLIPRPPLSDLEAFEFGLREFNKRPVIVTRVTACNDDLSLGRMRTGSLSPAVTPLPGTVMVEIEHQRTVESVGVCGLDEYGNEIKDAHTDDGELENGRKRDSAGWVREGRMRAERSTRTETRPSLAAMGAPMEKLEREMV